MPLPAQQLQHLLKITWQRSAQVERCRRDRMRKSNSLRMEHHARRLGQMRRGFPSVDRVAEQRMSDRFEMRANLVRAAGVDAAAHECGVFSKNLESLPIRARRP